MVVNNLRSDLLDIPGVEGAEVDGLKGSPQGLRIKISEGADQHAVGGAIRSVLDAHGLGTQTRLPGESSELSQEFGSVAVLTAEAHEPVAGLEESDHTVVSEPASLDDTRTVIDLTEEPPEIEPVTTKEILERVEPEEPPQPLDVSRVVAQTVVPSFIAPRTADASPSQSSFVRIDRVAVEEGRTGVHVTVIASDGTQVSQVATASEGGAETAVIKAAARLANSTAPTPIVVNIDDRRIEGVDIVMVVIDVDGELKTGSAVVGAGRVFALGRATWAALAL